MLRSPGIVTLAALLAVGCGTPTASSGPDGQAVASADAAAAPGADAAGVPDAGQAPGEDAATPADAAQNPGDAAAVSIDAALPAGPDAALEPPDAAPELPDADAPGLDASLRPFPVEGFGAPAVGGWQQGFSTYEVTSFDDDGPGTLREGLRTGDLPRVITFAADGTINLASSMLVPSNVSIDGRGRKVVLRNWGLILAGSDEVIVTNLAIEDIVSKTEDGVRIGDPTLGPSERVVLDHLRFTATTNAFGDSANVDEAVSVIFGSKDITFAWLRFEGWEKVMLFGNGDASPAVDAELRVTVHHTLARATGRRHPQARYGVFDFYSCFWDDWRMFDWLFASHYPESFGMQSQDSGHLLAESILFRRSNHTYDTGSQANDATRCESGGVLEGKDLKIAPGGNATLKFGVGCPASPAPWTRPYPATVDKADSALQSLLEAQTGNTL